MAALQYNHFAMKAANATAGSADDANDGLDPSGCNVSSGVYDDLGGANGDYSLTRTGAFAGIRQDDPIAITGGTGMTVGLFPVKEVISDNEVLFYESIGSDASDVSTSDGPKATIEGLLAEGAALDRLVIGDGTWRHASTGTWVSSDVAADFVSIFGADARGVVEGTQPILDGSLHSAGTSTFVFDNAGYEGWSFHNLRFTAGLLYNIEDQVVDVLGVSFFNCRIDNAVSHGVLHMSVDSWTFEDTEIDSNGGAGVSTTASTLGDGGAVYHRCRIHDNVSHGVMSSSTVQFEETLVYGNGGSGWLIDQHGQGSGANRSIFQGNAAAGVKTSGLISGFAFGALTNCHFADNDEGLGLSSLAQGIHAFQRVTTCWFYNNATAHISHPSSSNVLLGEAGIDTNTYDVDPEYESTASGTEDFRPKESSPLWGAGLAVAVR